MVKMPLSGWSTDKEEIEKIKRQYATKTTDRYMADKLAKYCECDLEIETWTHAVGEMGDKATIITEYRLVVNR